MSVTVQADRRSRSGTNRLRMFSAIFYLGFSILLLLILTDTLRHLVPASWVGRISYNSEAYMFIVVLAAWLQYGLPRFDRRKALLVAFAIGGLFVAIGLILLASDLPSRIRTLNESALALGILVPYVTLRRPLPRWVLLSVPAMVGTIVWAATSAPESWVIDQAETFGFLILAVLTFDLVDRRLLDSQAPVVAPRTWISWYVFLALEPVVVSALGTDVRQGGGPTALLLEFLGRIHESFIGVLIVALYLLLVRALAGRGATTGNTQRVV